MPVNLKQRVAELEAKLVDLEDARLRTMLLNQQLNNEADIMADWLDFLCGQDIQFCRKRCPNWSNVKQTCFLSRTNKEIWRETAKAYRERLQSEA